MNTPLVSNSLRALLRWWWLIALSISLGVGVGYILHTEQETLYIAQTILAIGKDPGSAAPVGANFDELSAYTVLVRRHTILQPVIDDLGLNLEVPDLLYRLGVEVDPLAPLINITVTDTDPDRAAVIANRIAEEVIFQTSDSGTVLDLNFINNQVETLQNQIYSLQDQYEELEEQAVDLISAFALNQNRSDRQRIEEAISGLRADLLELASNAPRSEVSVFDPAVPNYYPFVTNSNRDLIFAGIAGAVLSVLTIIIFTYFDDRLQWNEGREETIMGLRILGPLGVIPRNKLPLYVNTIPNSVETEALRQVRAKIALAAGGAAPRVLTFMSYDSGEGKTLISANYALESARSGMRTLVIDGDMRRGDLHELFQLPNIFGLSDALLSNDPLERVLAEAILDSGYENLWILPLGRAQSDPAALLSRPRFGEMIELLSRRYDAIMIDAAPTIGGPDSIFLGEVSTGLVIVVNTRRTRLSSLKRSIEELREGSNIHIYGLAFNRVRLQITSKYNNNYYRQTPSIDPDKLSHQIAKPRQGLLGLRSHVISNQNGEKLYSVTACAARLGVRKRTVRSWIESGHLTTERRLMRQWIAESKIDELMAGRQTAASLPAVEERGAVPVEASNGTGTHTMPDRLRAQRDAILDFANKPDHHTDAEI